MTIALYIIAVVTANIVTASLAPLAAGPFIIPWGTLLIGITFILRDIVQQRYGRHTAYLTIATALVLSALTSYLLGDTLMIVAASALSFALAETADTEIFSRLRTSFARRVFYSGVVGGAIDSTAFVIVGLSPIGAGFLPWAAVPAAILGQFIVKGALQGIGAGALTLAKGGGGRG